MIAQTIIRPAAPADAAVLSGIAVRSKAHWGYPPEFMAACREELTVTADLILSAGLEYYVATQDEAAIGFYALASSSPQEWELEALFVEPRVIDTGVGKVLFHHAAARARSSGGQPWKSRATPMPKAFTAPWGRCLLVSANLTVFRAGSYRYIG